VTPRAYRMSKRAEAVEETRRRIVEASLALHSDKGILATSWQDIAERADVAVGTVYYHFPTFDELIPACSSLGFEQAAPPRPEMFDGLRSTRERLDRLVRELFAFYERGRGGIEAMLRDMDGVPVLARVAEEQRTYLRALVLGALDNRKAKKEADLVEALLDFRVWLSLAERGIRKEEAVKTMTHLLRCATEKK
jgi:AcrR family transcriptional regulator